MRFYHSWFYKTYYKLSNNVKVGNIIDIYTRLVTKINKFKSLSYFLGLIAILLELLGL